MSQFTMEQEIKFLVESLINDEQLFTTVDVTKALRAVNPVVFARHAQISNIVHQVMNTLMSERGYTRSLIDVNTKEGPEKAYLYFPSSIDEDLIDELYDNSKRSQSTND